jgi:hypothetical protein
MTSTDRYQKRCPTFLKMRFCESTLNEWSSETLLRWRVCWLQGVKSKCIRRVISGE